MSKVKVLYLVSNLKRCGPINVLYNILKNINREKFDLYIICLSNESKHSRKKDFERLCIKIENLNYHGVKNIGIHKGIKEIENYIKLNSIDIVHSHGIRGDYINSNLKLCKSITTIHSYPYNDYPMAYGKLKGNLIAYIHTKIINKIDIVCTCSESVSTLFSINQKLKFPYVQNGIDIDIFKPVVDKYKKMDLRSKLDIPIKNRVFIVVGNVVSGKSIDTILKCFSKKHYKDNILIILGDGNLYKKYKECFSKYKNIVFVGRVTNVSEYMNASDYYISASLAEGLPNTVLEAMASGLPCILSNIDPHNELVKYNETIKYMFEVRDVEGLNKNIQKIIQKDYDSLSKKSRELAVSYFSAKNMAKNYEEKYLNLVKI